MFKKFTFAQGNLSLEVEIDKYARQADGAAWLKSGNNVVLTTTVASKEEKEFIGFFPLTVELRERMAAAGKIPGGYIKREGKLSDSEVLNSRLIDRSIRPLFPKFYFNEVQIFSTVYSFDGQIPLSVLGLLSTSISLAISPIPILGAIGAVQACRVNGTWLFNVDYQTSLKADATILIAGIKQGICMVEGNSSTMSEAEFVNVMFQAHELIKEQIAWQESIQKELGVVKQNVTSSLVTWELWEKKVKDFFPSDFGDLLFAATKSERETAINQLQKSLLDHFAPAIEAKECTSAILNFLFDSLLKTVIPDIIAKRNQRLDGRSFHEIRPIEVEVGMLPCSHGSGTFRRGETQVLSSITLGTAQDAQKVETLLDGTKERTFMLHYNFPPFSTGEIRQIRSVGRREIGHGYLAEVSFLNVLPPKDTFPYTIRVVADVLECNGSSSMATVCATTMALMDGGIPISAPVGGIAMGLIRDSQGTFHILTDILGTEDAYGLMDFKITGTTKGIMAIQMDIKTPEGLTRDLLVRALDQAREARINILGEMTRVLAQARPAISQYAPQIFMFKIDSSKIGNIIGPSGKTIKEIIATTNTEIDIEDDGTVKVYAKNVSDADKAKQRILILAGDIEVGTTFDGIVRRITDFGIFVELVPGKDGLVHISSIDREKQSSLEQNVKIGSSLKVRVTAYEKETGRVRLVAPELEYNKKRS